MLPLPKQLNLNADPMVLSTVPADCFQSEHLNDIESLAVEPCIPDDDAAA